MNENEIGKIIVDATFKIHNVLDAKLLESIFNVVHMKDGIKRMVNGL